MATVAPVHYIRTIHTSFTAAHPHSTSAWATQSAVARTHAHANLLLGLYNLPSSTTNYPPGLPTTMGRKRSASIRAPPQRIKFDPFAEDSSSEPPASVLYNTPSARSPVTRPASIPYTIHIPPAAPADIQRHHQQQQAFRQQQPGIRVRSARPHHQQQQQSFQPVQRVSTPAVVASPNTNVTAAALREREQRSKIVAGILLNRVHAVGKPMRRRSTDQPRPYVPSGLSTCIATEA